MVFQSLIKVKAEITLIKSQILIKMKKVLILLVCVTAFISCKNDNKSKDAEMIEAEQAKNLTVLQGDYVYFDDAAVLQTRDDIYGVLITDKTKELNKKAQAFKNEPTDMVQIKIKGRVTNQKDDKILWENKVEIVEILSIKAISKEENNVVKIGKE